MGCQPAPRDRNSRSKLWWCGIGALLLMSFVLTSFFILSLPIVCGWLSIESLRVPVSPIGNMVEKTKVGFVFIAPHISIRYPAVNVKPFRFFYQGEPVRRRNKDLADTLFPWLIEIGLIY